MKSVQKFEKATIPPWKLEMNVFHLLPIVMTNILQWKQIGRNQTPLTSMGVETAS